MIADYQRLLTFDLDGKYLYTTKMEGSSAMNEIVSTQKNTILGLHGSIRIFHNYLFSEIGKEGVLRLLFEREKAEAQKARLLIAWRALLSTDSCYYFKYSYCDTIFSLSHDLEQAEPAYYIDYGKKKIPMIEVAPDEDVLSWEKKLKRLNDYWDIASFGVGKDFLYIGTTDKAYNGYLTLYSHRTQKIFTARKLLDDMYLKGNVIPITAKRIPHNMVGNDIILEVSPKVLLDGYKRFRTDLSEPKREEFKQNYPEWYRICTSLKEDDNPVLLRIKIKSF